MLRWTVRLLALQGLALLGLLTVGFRNDPEGRAIVGMTWGLVLIWIVGAGTLMYRRRHAWGARLARSPLGPRTTFVLSATALALLEEVVTTAMSNAAPLFGVEHGSVMITASLNYFDVILRNSVIVFVPMFVAWAWQLGRYEFRPAQVFLLFGVTGALAETMSSGPQQLLGIGMWTFVYGLMVFVPAFAFSDAPERRPVRLRHLPLAVASPIASAVPVAIGVLAVT